MKKLTLISNDKLSLAVMTYIGRTVDEFPAEMLDELYGTGSWVCCFEDELPVDFSVDTYTIVDGTLALASDEVLATRVAAREVTRIEQIRQQRAARFTAETDLLLFDALEKFAAFHPDEFTDWLNAKAIIREELPK